MVGGSGGGEPAFGNDGVVSGSATMMALLTGLAVLVALFLVMVLFG